VGTEVVPKGRGQDTSSAGESVLAMIRAKYPEYHPLMAIATMAHDNSIEDPRLKLDCHKTILKYVQPELRSIEVKGEIDVTHRRVIVSMFDGETFEGDPNMLRNLPAVEASAPDPLWDRLEVEDAILIENAA